MEPFHYWISNAKHYVTSINAKLPDDGSSRIGQTFHVQLCKPREGEKVVVYFHTKMEQFGHEDFEDDYNHFVDQLISQWNFYCTAGCGWVVASLLAVEIKVAATIRETGSSYIETPASLSGLRGSILNVQNKREEFCSLYSVLANLYPHKKNVDGPSSYIDKYDELRFQNMTFQCV